MSDPVVPFNRACAAGRETEYMAQALANGHVAGDGPFSRKCHAFLEEALGTRKALLTTSCTHALEMAAILLDVKAGDEVVLPSFTFVSTANAFVLRGAVPVFVDIRPDTLNMDERLLAARVGPRTRAIVPVHYAGVACEMDAIMDVARRASIAVVEDNAHGLFGRYMGRHLGTFGILSAQSFHETKNLTCGEGGALLVNDASLAERAEIVREKGTDRSRFFRRQAPSYTWKDIGSSYLPSDLLAAFLLAQMEKHEIIQATRRAIWIRYMDGLSDWAQENGVRLPIVPEDREQPWHMFQMILPSREAREALIGHLGERGILAVSHYLPLHLSEMGRRLGGKDGDCPVAEAASGRLIRLPFFNDLREPEQAFVIESVKAFASSRDWRSLAGDPFDAGG